MTIQQIPECIKKTALASAKTALSEKKSQDAVDKAASDLNTAIQGLKKAEVTTESYVLMNIPYAAFYESDGVTSVDSVSSATLNKNKKFKSCSWFLSRRSEWKRHYRYYIPG